MLGVLGVTLVDTLGPASSEAQAAHERADLVAGAWRPQGPLRARWNLWRVYNARANSFRCRGSDALLAEAEAEGDVDHEVQARHALSASRLFRGDLEATCHHVDHMLPSTRSTAMEGRR